MEQTGTASLGAAGPDMYLTELATVDAMLAEHAQQARPPADALGELDGGSHFTTRRASLFSTSDEHRRPPRLVRPTPVPGRSTEPPGGDAARPPLRPVPSRDNPLPHRVPAPPDVPDLPGEDFDDDGEFEGPVGAGALPDNRDLARITSGLREQDRASIPDELDVEAVLAAVRDVPGVRDAQLRPNPDGVHTLRLDLADGADPGLVSREVAKLLKERMGLAAEPRRNRSAAQAPPEAPPLPAPRQKGTVTDARRPAGAAPTVPQPAGPRQPVGAGPTARRLTGEGQPVGDSDPTVPMRRAVSVTDYLDAYRTGSPHAKGPRPSAMLADSPSRVVLDQVNVSTLGTEATVEVRLHAGTLPAVGTATGPAVDGYLLRLAAQAAAGAVDVLMATGAPGARRNGTGLRCFIDHAGVVPFGACNVAVVVVLVSGDGWVEQLVGSALVSGDPRDAVVRAMLSAVNRRLESLLM